ncbi:hypothetical protein F511_28270 [Dorcoceras hygrometricum]|uniref:Uncharacterized protein n=1 Tax=Dorcoceras hygrometricum TaxID=472368 RepID=A0A2Z7B9B6_9LAMI|nr:hypothetical protein F511_28270 [Dorcoceras hygrometricum]
MPPRRVREQQQDDNTAPPPPPPQLTPEHCDVLSIQMDSDLVIYRTTLVRTFQVITICRVDKSEVLVVLISPHYSKLFRGNRHFTVGGGGGLFREEGGGGFSSRLSDGFGSGPTGPGPTDEHSVHPHHRDFIVTKIADQIGPIDSVSKTEYYDLKNHFSEPQCKMTVLPLNSGKSRLTLLTFRKSHSPKSSSHAQNIEMSITDSSCKNQLVVVSVQYGPFNPYITIRSTTIGKSRVAIDPIAMRTSWRSNSDIASVTSIGYPRMSASGESSTTMHRLLHASGSHPIPTPYEPKRVGKWVKVRRLSCRVSMTFRVVRNNQYNQDLGLIHSTNGNHLESPNEGSSIDHQVTIYLHAQNITMFPTNEIWYFALQILVSSSGGLILILTAQSTRNMFRIHSDY